MANRGAARIRLREIAKGVGDPRGHRSGSKVDGTPVPVTPRNAMALDTLAGVRGEMARLYRLGLAGGVGDLTDYDPMRPAGLVSMRLDRSAPAAIQQNTCRRHARGRWHAFLADDPGEHLDA